MKRFIVLIFIIAAVGLYISLHQIYKSRFPELPYDEAQRTMPRHPERAVRDVTLNGNHLKIPFPYFKTSVPPEGEQRDILLAVLYPEFKYFERSPRDLWADGKWDDKIVILIKTPVGRRDLVQTFKDRKSSLHATDHSTEIYNLKRFIPESSGWGDFFEVPSERGSVSFIQCGDEGNSPNAQCDLHFSHRGMLVEVGFDRDLLQNWKLILDKTKNIIDKFAIEGGDDGSIKR